MRRMIPGCLLRSPCSLWRPSRFPRQLRRAGSGESRTGGESGHRGGKAITAAECTAERLGATIAPSAIGEPVRSARCRRPPGSSPRTGRRRIAA